MSLQLVGSDVYFSRKNMVRLASSSGRKMLPQEILTLSVLDYAFELEVWLTGESRPGVLRLRGRVDGLPASSRFHVQPDGAAQRFEIFLVFLLEMCCRHDTLVAATGLMAVINFPITRRLAVVRYMRGAPAFPCAR